MVTILLQLQIWLQPSQKIALTQRQGEVLSTWTNTKERRALYNAFINSHISSAKIGLRISETFWPPLFNS